MREEAETSSQMPRRRILQGGLAAAAMGALTTSAPSPASAATTGGDRAIDIHAHYFPQSFLDLLAQEGERYGMKSRATADGFFIGQAGPYATKFIDLDLRLAEMDKQGVGVHALSLTSPMLYWADSELAQKLARAWNDAGSAAHRAHPERFVALATLPMQDPDRALDELNRASQLPGVRGIYLGTNIQDKDLDDPMFLPVFARIEALGLPIFLHPLKTVGGDRTKPFYLANLIGNPLDTGIAAAHLICGGVLDRFPKLDINLPHAGGVLPILIGRIDHGFRVRKELKHLPQPPSAYLRRFTYDTITHSKAVMSFVISQVGSDRVMLGSDYCFDMGYEHPVEVVNELALDDEARKMILGGTASKLLKL